jgi:hypothetical protein
LVGRSRGRSEFTFEGESKGSSGHEKMKEMNRD